MRYPHSIDKIYVNRIYLVSYSRGSATFEMELSGPIRNILARTSIKSAPGPSGSRGASSAAAEQSIQKS